MPRIVSLFLVLFLLATSATPLSAQQIDPRLQQALDLIATTEWGRDEIVPRFSSAGVHIVFGTIPEGRIAHYDPNAKVVVFAEDTRTAPLEIIAWILVHESYHVQQPWTEKGLECFHNEANAEFDAATWWLEKYGESGHPNTGHELVRYFNWLAYLLLHERDRFLEVVIDSLVDTCALPTPTPTPTPVPTPVPVTNLTLEQRIAELEKENKRLWVQIFRLHQQVRDLQYGW